MSKVGATRIFPNWQQHTFLQGATWKPYIVPLSHTVNALSLWNAWQFKVVGVFTGEGIHCEHPPTSATSAGYFWLHALCVVTCEGSLQDTGPSGMFGPSGRKCDPLTHRSEKLKWAADPTPCLKGDTYPILLLTRWHAAGRQALQPTAIPWHSVWLCAATLGLPLLGCWCSGDGGQCQVAKHLYPCLLSETWEIQPAIHYSGNIVSQCHVS